jgi:hypothetical protein
MASVNATTDRNSLNGSVLVTWALADADTGTAFPIPYAADLTVQVSGTFGSATAVLEGSNDGTNWSTLNAVVGTNTSFTAAGMRKTVENPGYIRAKTTGGTASAISVVVAIKAMFDKKAY